MSRPAPALAALLLAVLLASALPTAGQSAGVVLIEAEPSATARLDLRSDAGKVATFTLDEDNFPNAQGATSMAVRLTKGGELLSMAAQKGTGGVWTATLPVDTVDLVAGDWTTSFFAVRPTGGVLVKQRALNVTLSDATPPMLQVLPLGDPIRLGPGASLEVEVDGEFLRAVTVMHAGLPQPLKIVEPYRVPVGAFAEGVNDVTVTASDRAGHVSTAAVKVDRDTEAPTLDISYPEVGYTGVPFAIVANATERSQHSVRLVHNGSAETRSVGASAEPTTRQHVFVSTIPTMGNQTYVVDAFDAVGNRVSSIFTVPIVQPPTDLRAVDVSLAPGEPTFVGQPAKVVATVEQLGGVTALPVTVTFTTAGQSATMTVTVPAVGAKLVEWNVTLPPGPREVAVHVEGPGFANETAPGNENASATIETFLGSVRVGDDLFLIRADERGLPVAAFVEGTTKSYPLELVQDGRGVQYEFHLAGNRTGRWDPLDPIAKEAQPEQSESSTSTGSKGAAAPGLLMALLVVAFAALVQRRRR